jgi:hypothetical protein
MRPIAREKMATCLGCFNFAVEMSGVGTNGHRKSLKHDVAMQAIFVA